ncbi:hypothetical protein Hypma_007598 [Hypsizygus marmoreus]|uniref:SAP domain-containing protein n=1 Tax=Hypsizygus marmoreus TaxID=39966 RepID=A0A369JU03_HYPMA|nr:hypothetical protein Hypma_007598 [Hypsizygus marmoreus]
MSRVLPVRDRTTLAKLGRPELQQLAKRERVKATGKNSEIIDRLLTKYPDGVPRHQTPVVLGDNPRKRKSVSVKEEPDAVRPSVSTRRQTKKRKVDASTIPPPVANDAVAASGAPSARSVRFTSDWVEATRTATAPVHEPVAPASAPEPPARAPSPPLPPGDKDVRFVRRELTRLIDDGVDLRAEVDDLAALLESTRENVKDSEADLKELSCMRRSLEDMVTRRLKSQRQLWDGTYMMKDKRAKAEWDTFIGDLYEDMRLCKEEVEEELIQERVPNFDDDKEGKEDGDAEEDEQE